MLEWNKILVATDFSPPSRVALRSAEALAARVGGTLEVLHVVERLPERYKLLIGALEHMDLDAERQAHVERKLQRLIARLTNPKVAVETSVRRGRPSDEILKAARETEAELICLGNSGHSRLERLLLGATAESVVRRSPIPVLVTRGRLLGKLNRVLVPVDFDDGSKAALEFALTRLPRTIRLDALHVLPPLPPFPDPVPWYPDEKELKAELLKFVRSAGAGRAKCHVVVFGDPAEEVLRHAKSQYADLILLSTHGRRGFGRFLMGSVAEKVVRYAHRPVLVLPGPGPASVRRSKRARSVKAVA